MENSEYPDQLEITNKSGITLKLLSSEIADIFFALIERNRDHLSQFGEETGKVYISREIVLDSILTQRRRNKLRLGIYNSNNELVGIINLIHINRKTGELGYWVGEEFKGNNYSSKATIVLLEYIFNMTNYEKVIAYSHTDNKRSQTVLLKSGFKFVGPDDKEANYLVFEITKEMFE